MKKAYFIVSLIFVFSNSYGQVNLDSLNNIWLNSSKPDSIRVIALKEYIYEGFFYTNTDSAILLTDQLYAFSEKANLQAEMVDAMSILGYIYFRTGDYINALASYEKGLAIAENIDDKIGNSTILLRIGYIYHDTGDIMMALVYYRKSLKIFEELNDLDGIGSVFNEFGSIYLGEGDYEKAHDYYQKSLAINTQLDHELANAPIYLNIGRVYLDQEDYSKALEYFEKGLAIDEKSGDQLGIASALGNIGELYLSQENEERALEYLKKSLKISDEILDIQGSVASMLSIAQIYADQGKYSESISLCKKSLALAEELGDIDDQVFSCECLYYAYKAMGQGNKALAYHEQMLVLSDSLKTDETAKNIQSMEFAKIRMQDSLAQVEKELKTDLLHKDELRKKEKNRNIAIVAGIFFLLLAGGFYSRWRYVNKSKEIIEKEKDRSENLLLNILPAEIAEELKEKGSAASRDFDMVSILFSDFVDFTQTTEKLSAKDLISEINHCFKAFDHICGKYGIEKIKTIGDAYMAAGGLPVPSDKATKNTILAGLEMQAFINKRAKQKKEINEIPFKMRLGIHTGPVVAGIVGVKKFQYDIWGDTVNIASRLENAGETGKINISEQTYEQIKNDSEFHFQYRGKVKAKGKGEIDMYFVSKSK